MTKRYDQYKDSGIEWLDEIPSHWKNVRIKDIATATIGLTYSPNDVTDVDSYNYNESNLVLRSTNIQNEKISLHDNVYVKNENINKNLILKLNDIVICSRNGSKKLVGKNALIDSKSVGMTFGAFTTMLRSKHNRYLFYVLNSSLKDYQASLTSTSTINQLTTKMLNGFKIGLPKETEQQAIATYLDNKTSKIDSAVSELEKQKSLLIELKKSTIHQAVTKGLDLTVPMKDSGVEWIGEVPSHWDMKRIKDKLINLGGGKYGEDEGKLDLDIPCISISDFRNGNISTNKKIKMKRSYSISNIMKKGTLLVEKSGGGEKNPVGRVIMLEKDIEAYYTNFVASLKTLENEKFCYYLMKNIHNRRVHMPFVKQNTGLQNFDYNGFSLFQKVSFPSKFEQNKIVDYLDKKTGQIDQSIEVIDNQIAKMKEYKKTLINDVVTGKIKVV